MDELDRRAGRAHESRLWFPTGLILSVLAVSGTGCDAAASGDAGSVVRDSAGITIVENRGAAWDASAAWTVSEDPLLDIGVASGPDEYQLYRAWSAVRRSDGTIVIANGGTNELRFFDRSGQYLFTVGRSGEGPGEFQDLQHVWLLREDSLLAYDFGPSRLSVFSPSGEYVRSLHVRAPDGRQVLVRGPLADGSLIAVGAPIWNAPGSTTGVVRDSVPYYRYDAEGVLLGGLGLFPSREVFREVTGDGWRLTGLPFPRAPLATVAGRRFHFGPADMYEIRTFTPAGDLERVIRLADGRRAVTSDDIDRFRREQLEGAEREGTRPAMERMLSEMPYPEWLPPYEQLEVDPDGNLWVADYRTAPDEDQSWKVFSRDGEWLGTVDLPPRLEVFQIGAEHVLGRWTDDLEVEHIQVYGLERPQRD